MSTYYITEPENIPFETIKAAVHKSYDINIYSTENGNATITMFDYVNYKKNRVNWLHLEIDKETQTMTACFRNGTSDASEILKYLETFLKCKFISEYEPKYWGFKDWSDGGKSAAAFL